MKFNSFFFFLRFDAWRIQFHLEERLRAFFRAPEKKNYLVDG